MKTTEWRTAGIKLHYSNRKVINWKLLIVSSIILMFPSLLFAQSPDAYKKFINKSTIVVYQAQKTMIATHTNDVNGKLAQLFILQMNAVASFNKGDLPLAAGFSNMARQNALEIIASLGGKQDGFYDITIEESELFKNSPDKIELKVQARKAFPLLSEKDQDYILPGSIERRNMEIQ
jgi:hypothetical protein